MKPCRRGFIRCSGRDGPWGSHQEEARAEKWEISVALTEAEEGVWRVGAVVLRVRDWGWDCWSHGAAAAAAVREAGRPTVRRASGTCRSGGGIFGCG
jgi:hypothetical protein